MSYIKEPEFVVEVISDLRRIGRRGSNPTGRAVTRDNNFAGNDHETAVHAEEDYEDAADVDDGDDGTHC